METKEFSTSACLSLISGRLLCDSLAVMQGLAGWVAGHQVWTHELGDKDLLRRLSDELIRQHPMLAESANATLTKENCKSWLESEVERIGSETLMIKRGESQRSETPLDSWERMHPGKHVISYLT